MKNENHAYILFRFLDQYYKQFEDRTEKVQLDQMAQESITHPRLALGSMFLCFISFFYSGVTVKISKMSHQKG